MGLGSIVLLGHVAHLGPAMGFQQAGVVAQQRVDRLLEFVLILGPNVAIKPSVEVFGRVSVHYSHGIYPLSLLVAMLGASHSPDARG